VIWIDQSQGDLFGGIGLFRLQGIIYCFHYFGMWFITETTWIVGQTYYADQTTTESAYEHKYD